MPSQSITLDEEQYGYILQTKADDQSVSERVRELVDIGISEERSTGEAVGGNDE